MEKLSNPPSPPTSSLKLIFLVLGVIIIWGLSWPVSKIGLGYMSPGWFVTFRLLIGSFTMFVIVASCGRFALPRLIDLPIILVIGLLQVALFMLFVNYGLHHVDASRSAILVYTTPIWVIPLAIFFFDEKVTVLQWIGFLLGVVGIVILLGPWAMDWSDPQTLLGNGCLLLAALSWAISMLCARHMEWSRPPFELIVWQLLVAVIPISCLAFITEPYQAIQWSPTLFACLLYAGVLATAFGYWGVVVISKELPSSKASLSFLGVPLAGFLFSALLLHEAITASIIGALSFILAGLIFVAIPKAKR